MEDIEEVIVEEPYGFIYVSTNMCNGKRYLGRRKFSEDWQWYYGSGAIFRKAMKKYGKENFKRDIIDIAYSEKELNQKEYEYSTFFNVVESDDWYNLVYGGGTTAGYHASDETKKKIGDKAKKRLSNPKNHPRYGKDGLKGKENPMFGISPKERMDEETYKTWYTKQKARLNDFVKSNERSVYCIEYNKYYDSIKNAKLETGATAIPFCCNGKYSYSGKTNDGRHLHWLWANEVNEENIKLALERAEQVKGIRRRVMCIDTGVVYPSINEASRQVERSPASIYACCKGEQKHTAGFVFRYATEEEYREYRNKIENERN